VGADQPYTINFLAETVAAAMAVELKPVHLEARNEVTHAYSSHEKLREIFGPREYCPLQEGVARMARWAKRVGPRKGSVFTAIDIKKNLPPSWASLIVSD
jgi:UDP-glucose 4-epimerase